MFFLHAAEQQLEQDGWMRLTEREREILQPLHLPAWANNWQKTKKKKKRDGTVKNQIKWFFSLQLSKEDLWRRTEAVELEGRHNCACSISVYTSVYEYLLLCNYSCYCFILKRLIIRQSIKLRIKTRTRTLLYGDCRQLNRLNNKLRS